jgi:hypothetical protein
MTIIHVSGKVNDLFDLTIDNLEYDGYVPKCAIGDGDNIFFSVNAETGQILNWKNPLDDPNFRQQINYNNEGE